MGRAPLPLAQTALSAVNHVLQQQPDARARLRIHAGRSLRIVVEGPLGSFFSDATISSRGLLSLTTEAAPAAVLIISPGIDAAFGALMAGSAGFGSHLRVEGDIMLAAAAGEVARSLRWDFEDDLSRLVGDAIAHRFGSALRAGLGQARTLRVRSGQAFQRTAAAEDGPLVANSHLAELAASVHQLSVRVGELEMRAMHSPAPDLSGVFS